MDKFNVVLTTLMIAIGIFMFTMTITLVVVECDYELWVGDEPSSSGKYINQLIESKADSVIVVDPSKPMPVGVLYFKPYK